MSSSAIVPTSHQAKKPIKIQLPEWMEVPPKLTEFLRADLQMLMDECDEKAENYLGYPNNFSIPNVIPKAFKTLLLNIADPRNNKYRGPNTHDYEHDIIAFLKELWSFPENETDWGSSCSGSSEAVLSAILYARERFARHTPVVYCNTEAHYCVKKNSWITGLDCVAVEVLQDGGMDNSDLKQKLEANKGRPAIVVATCGTTVREGHDDLAAIVATLKETETDYYIHVDAALCGATAPSLSEISLGKKPSFKNGVHSISVSLHKFPGANKPGAFLLGRVIPSTPGRSTVVSYIDAQDTTTSGSRNGTAVLGFWMRIILFGAHAWGKEISDADIEVMMDKTRNNESFPDAINEKIMVAAVAGIAKEARMCADYAKDLAAQLRKIGVPVFHNPGALTVYFPEPSKAICDKYTLACAPAGGLFGGKGAHVITMQHTGPIIPSFVADYAVWYKAPHSLSGTQ